MKTPGSRAAPSGRGVLLVSGAVLAVVLGFAFLPAAGFAGPADLRGPLPPDRGLESGSLRSGLSFYLRPTARPEDRIVFRLVVAAGSAREADDERGFAHFVEHMSFNGTSARPGNALDDLMSALDGGLELEANAFTYPDCTVYHLELPSGLPDALELGFGMLRQWASEILFDPAEVDLEKGVIRAELREYDTPEERLYRRVEEALYGGTPLGDHGILGTLVSVEGVRAPGLRKFYHREYVPGRMAAIAAGPFEAVRAREALERAFSGFGDRSPRVRSPAFVPAEPSTGLSLVRAVDPRRARTELRLLFRESARVLGTAADWAREYRSRLAAKVLEGRLEGRAEADAPWAFLGAGRREERFGERLWEISLSCAAGAEAEALRSLGRELGLLQARGADPAEAGIGAGETGLSLPYPDPDAYDAVEAAIRSFLYGDAVFDPGFADDLEARLRESALAADAPPAGTSPGDLPSLGEGVLSVVRPGPGGPSDGELLAAYLGGLCEGRAARAVPSPGNSKALSGLSSEFAASAGFPSSRVARPDGSISLVLANGLRVRIRATGSGEGWAYLCAWSPGGLAGLPAPLRAAADEAPAILARAGYPAGSPSALRSELAGTWAYWRADVDSREEFVEADGGSGDLELLFRLLAASFRAPAVSPAALRRAAALRAEELRLASGPEAEFRAAAESGLSTPSTLPEPEVVESWDAEFILTAWADRFGDPGDFEFLAVGDFEEAAAERLAAAYLGSLIVQGRRESVPVQPPIPAPGLRVTGGGLVRGRVLAVWALRGLPGPDIRDLVPLARSLETRLFRRLREDLAETYDVYCSWEPFPGRPGSGEFRIEFEAAPERAVSLADELMREVRDFSSGRSGITIPAAAPAPAEKTEGDEETYRRMLDEMRAGGEAGYRAASGNSGAAGADPSPGRLSELAARVLRPEAASVFVLASGR